MKSFEPDIVTVVAIWVYKGARIGCTVGHILTLYAVKMSPVFEYPTHSPSHMIRAYTQPRDRGLHRGI
jgi:hypothetical protein